MATPPPLRGMRTDYPDVPLRESDLAADPLAQFAGWLHDAVQAGLPEPNAMVLATAAKDGAPSARIVLLKGVDNGGFVFYTNYESRKARELAANPQASLLFFWGQIFINNSLYEGRELKRLPGSELCAFSNLWNYQISRKTISEAARGAVLKGACCRDNILNRHSGLFHIRQGHADGTAF